MRLAASPAPLVALGLAILAPAPCPAHPNHGETLGERYVKVHLEPGGGRLVYGLTYTARFGLAVRREADANGDGRVDEAERAARARVFVEAVNGRVRVLVDGAPATLEWAPPFMGPAEAVRAGPLALEAAASFPLAPGERVVAIEDGAEFEGIFRTELALAAGGGAKLLRAGRADRPTGLETRVVLLDLPSEGPAPPRRATAVALLPGGRTGPRAWPWAAGAAVVLASIVTVARWARGRRARRYCRGKG